MRAVAPSVAHRRKRMPTVAAPVWGRHRNLAGGVELTPGTRRGNISTMKTLSLLAVTSAALYRLGCALAQAATDSGSFLVRRGRDTVATERFVRTATKLEGTLSIRNAKATSERYAAVLAPDGSVPLIEVTVQEGADSGSSRPRIVQRARVIFKEDSAAVDEIGSSGLVTRVMGTESGAIPYLNLSFALIEQAVRRARAANQGSSVPFLIWEGDRHCLPSSLPRMPTRCAWISVTLATI